MREVRRREFIMALACTAALWPLGVRAQQATKIPRLCFLTFDPGTLRTRSPRFDGFFQGLQELGYVNARNIEISYLSADNNGDRFPALIDECLSLKPDVIAVTTTPAAHLLKKATRDVPIVMVALGDPLGTGLVDSLSRPAATMSGRRISAKARPPACRRKPSTRSLPAPIPSFPMRTNAPFTASPRRW
jgi:putative tryptophan/tyrosine transport system substrate-binding protein